jgi:8-oxo-dGTP pyrophosphatase MutT (NUDIX family)
VTTAHEQGDRLAPRLSAELAGWSPGTADQRALKSEYQRFLAEAGAAAVERDLGRVHVTASAFVFTPDLRDVLLCLHRKAGFWVQLGGHVEPTDGSVAAAARREAQEEGGIADLVALGDTPLDLDRHELGAGFTRCDVHWDVGYAFVATGVPSASDESEAVGWWSVDRLPRNVPPGFGARVRRAAQLAGPGTCHEASTR